MISFSHEINASPTSPHLEQVKAYLTHSLLVATVLRDRAMRQHLGDGMNLQTTDSIRVVGIKD